MAPATSGRLPIIGGSSRAGNLVGEGETAALKFVCDTTDVLHIAAGLDGFGGGKHAVTFAEDPSFAPWSVEEIAGYLTK